MTVHIPQINLLAAWLGILLGFASGLGLGLFFHHENWLGGYGSFQRRMYRLAHISLFGLGAVNLFFWLTAKMLFTSSPLLTVASWAFVTGAITMPIGCGLLAHFPKARVIFAVPVVSLLVGGALTVLLVIGGGPFPQLNPQISTLNPP